MKRYQITPPPIRAGYLGNFNFLTLGCSILLLFVACSKDELKTAVVTDFDPKYTTYYKLASFIEKMEGKKVSYPVLIPRSDYTPTEARNYIEGGLNLQYTDPELTWEDYDETTDTFNVALSGGMVTEATVESIYDIAVDSASAFFYRIGEPDKFPYLFDAFIISSGLSSIQLAITIAVGKVHRDPTPFGESDFWSVFEEGLCSPTDDPSGIEAADLQNDALNDWYTPYGCGVWFDIQNIGTDELITHGWETINPYDDIEEDQIMDYRTFVVVCDSGTEECSELAENGVFCLSPEEMNFYFLSIVSIYDNYAEAEEVSLRLSDFGLLSQPIGGNEIRFYWTGSNRWGVREDCMEGGPFPYALPPCC